MSSDSILVKHNQAELK